MLRHGAHPDQITALIMDMSTGFIAGAQKYFPGAKVIFDHFHIMQMAGVALEEVRKALAAAGADLKGGIRAIRGNEWTRSEKQLEDRRRFIRDYPKLGRALGLRDSLQSFPWARQRASSGGALGRCAVDSPLFENSPKPSKLIGRESSLSWKPA